MDTQFGTIERKPYVGDSDVLVVTCDQGDYTRTVKGAGERGGPGGEAAQRRAEKGLADHTPRSTRPRS